MSFIDNKYKAGTKIDEEVPRMFKLHGYPFTICKSAMFTIGSPHTWPTMLAALSWLRQMIQVISMYIFVFITFRQLWYLVSNTSVVTLVLCCSCCSNLIILIFLAV